MSDSISPLPANPSLEQLQKQAKDLLRQYRAGDTAALNRLQNRPDPSLADAQFIIAREHGFESWGKLKHHIEALRPPAMEQYEQLARKLAIAYSGGDKDAIRELNWDHGTAFVWDHDPLNMQRRLTTWFASEARTQDLALMDAKRMVAQSYGFESWAQLTASVEQPPTDPRAAALFISSRPPFYQVDWKDNRLTVRGPQSAEDWDVVLGVIKEHGITKLTAGSISDSAMRGLARLDDITHLELGGSREFTDDGAKYLAYMPQLRDLELGGPTSQLTDRALEPLRHLAELRRFQCCWTQGISDAGAANLDRCEHLEIVNLMGTMSGDGVIQALAGKRRLRHLNTGRKVTDAGLTLLHQIPTFKTWQGGDIEYNLMSFGAEPNNLLLDGPFTDEGLASLAGLDGLFGLGFFWHCPAFTSGGLASLKHLQNLGFLGCQDKHCDDEAMEHIAAIPKLRMLMGQGSVATDKGFAAFSRSQTIEYFWGRSCPNLTGQGFAALAEMPALRGIAVSCKNVNDAALSTLPRFPALRQLMPMDMSDAGFRHVGGCEQLESLWCMYCRDTGDTATEHIAGLTKLRLYYAGMTQITDHSLGILSRMPSLEKIELWQCAGLTDDGIALLAALPNLREIVLDGLPRVTRKAITPFETHVRVKYSG